MEIIVSLNKKENLLPLQQLKATHVLISDGYFSSGTASLSRSEIADFIDEAHRLDLKVMVRLDRLYDESELSDLQKYLAFLNERKADGLLFSDVGVKMLVEQNHLELQTLYAPETLLTNSYDVTALKQDGFAGCVVSKDIPLEDSYQIINDNPDYCYLRLFGPILLSYSKRHFISMYLDEEKEHRDDYYLQEETRDLLMPMVEKEKGSWLYGNCLQSLDRIKEIYQLPLKGVLFDGIIYDDEFVLTALKTHIEVLNDKISAEEALQSLEKQDGKAVFSSISEIRKTSLNKE